MPSTDGTCLLAPSPQAAEYRPLLTALFTRYVDVTLEYCRRNFKLVVPLPAICQVMTVCKILDGILPKVKTWARGGG